MKKSKHAALVLFLLTVGIVIYPQQISVDSVRRHGETCLLDCRILLVDQNRLLTALEGGNTVMIGIRLREGSSEGSFFTPRAGYFEYQRKIHRDPVERLYIIEEPGGDRRFFVHKDALLEAVLTFRELEIPVPDDAHSFRLGGEIQWKLLIPPLNILGPFLPHLYSATPWMDIDLSRPKSKTGVPGK